MHSTLRKLALLVLMLGVVACGSTSTSQTHRIGQVTLVVSGGFTGWERHLTIDPDGTAHLTVIRGPAPTQGPHDVPQEQLEKLRTLLATDDFARLAAEYPAPPGGADLQTYDLTAEVDGKTIHTVTYDGANAPAVLRNVLDILNQVLVSFGT